MQANTEHIAILTHKDNAQDQFRKARVCTVSLGREAVLVQAKHRAAQGKESERKNKPMTTGATILERQADAQIGALACRKAACAMVGKM